MARVPIERQWSRPGAKSRRTRARDSRRAKSNHSLIGITCKWSNIAKEAGSCKSRPKSSPARETTVGIVGAHTSYVERTNLTARQMNGRLVRKTLSFSKGLGMLEASSVWEDLAYNLTRHVRTLRLEVNEENRRFQQRSPAMAAGLTDHIWTIKELLWMVATPGQSTQSG
jgi:hypothetical protein